MSTKQGWTRESTYGLIACAVILAIVVLTVWGLISWINSGPEPMTNEEIIRETKKCQDAGLYPSHRGNWATDTVKIVCENK